MKSLKIPYLTAFTAFISSIFCVALFKQVDQVGMYDWMVRSPEFVLSMSILQYLSVFSCAVSFSIIFIRCGRNFFIVLASKTLKSLMPFLLFFFINQFLDFLYGDQIILSFLTRIAILIFAISAFYLYFRETYFDAGYFYLPIIISGSILVFVNLLFYIVDKESVWPSGPYARFIGNTEHPNFIALICSILLVAINEAMVFFKKYNHISRTLYLYLRAVTVLLIAGVFASGSRTGLFLLIAYLLISYSYRSRRRNMFILLGGFSLTFFIILDGFQTITNIDGLRVTSTENTRTDAWSGMLNVFYENPFFGVGRNSVGFSENSYLWALSATGLFGFVFFILFLFTTLKNAKSSLENAKQQGAAFLVICVLLAAAFEGFLLDTLSFPIFITLYCSMFISNRSINA